MADGRTQHQLLDPWEASNRASWTSTGSSSSPFAQPGVDDHVRLIPSPPASPTRHNISASSLATIRRLRARQREKAEQSQNVQAGIKLVTDVSEHRNPSPRRRRSIFANSLTLRALEGGGAVSPESGPSPDGRRPIMVSIESDDSSPNGLVSYHVSPIMATPTTPTGSRGLTKHLAVGPSTPIQQVSVWSPDTPSTAASPDTRVSSVYSQVTQLGAGAGGTYTQDDDAPPMPQLPHGYSVKGKQPQLQFDSDDESGSPFTPFEEDGLSPASSDKQETDRKDLDNGIDKIDKAQTAAEKSSSPLVAQAPDWWRLPNTTQTPQSQSQSRRTGSQMAESAESEPESDPGFVSESTTSGEWWKGIDEKKNRPSLAHPYAKGSLTIMSTPVIRVPTPHRTASPAKSQHVSIHAGTSPVTQAQPTAAATVTSKYYWEEPPPYSPAMNAVGTTTTTTTPPSEKPGSARHHPHPKAYPPSPGPISPGFTQGMAPRGAISMVNIPMSSSLSSSSSPSPLSSSSEPALAVVSSPSSTPPLPLPPVAHLPDPVPGTFIPALHAVPVSKVTHKVEVKRRRHEKEDFVAHRVGGFCRGRGCLPKRGYFGQPGREGRKRRRVCMWLMVALVALIILASTLSAILGRKMQDSSSSSSSSADLPPSSLGPFPPLAGPDDSGSSPTAPATASASPTNNVFVTVDPFPPIPTGVLTVVGSDNVVSVRDCVEPPTAWSCSLPKEKQGSVQPFDPDQPTFIMQIQWDNSEDDDWNVPNGAAPPSIKDDMVAAAANESKPTVNGKRGVERKRRSRPSKRNIAFSPEPEPAEFEEMWFLGDTTDDVQSDDKAGEPTPFYVSILESADEPVGLNAARYRRDDGESQSLRRYRRRHGRQRRQRRQLDVPRPSLPPPEVNDDGTSAPAQFLPTPRQQPLRLFDRGLPTEHYGFYTYFIRTVYLRSVKDEVAIDRDGGSAETDADFIVSWGSVRYRVAIWTRPEGGDDNNNNKQEDDRTTEKKQLMEPRGSGPAQIGSDETMRLPGTMPLPVSVTLDLHGGDADAKVTLFKGLDDQQRVNHQVVGVMPVELGFNGTLFNSAYDKPDAKYGGVDGGSGGCKCEWRNWV